MTYLPKVIERMPVMAGIWTMIISRIITTFGVSLMTLLHPMTRTSLRVVWSRLLLPV